MQGGVERAIEHIKRSVGARADHARDSVAMLWPPRKRFEHEDVEGPLQQFELFGHVALFPQASRT